MEIFTLRKTRNKLVTTNGSSGLKLIIQQWAS